MYKGTFFLETINNFLKSIDKSFIWLSFSKKGAMIMKYSLGNEQSLMRLICAPCDDDDDEELVKTKFVGRREKNIANTETKTRRCVYSMHVGQAVRYHNPLYGHFNQLGIVVYETEGAWGVSLQKFNGQYLCILKTDEHLEELGDMSPAEKGGSWRTFTTGGKYAQHKTLYQSILLGQLGEIKR